MRIAQTLTRKSKRLLGCDGVPQKKRGMYPIRHSIVSGVGCRQSRWYKDCPCSTRSLQQIFHRAKEAAKIMQDVTFHSLRHSYATHLHEAGTDIKLIQELLGHNDLKTTLRYTHVSNRTLENIKSPFDSLNLKK